MIEYVKFLEELRHLQDLLTQKANDSLCLHHGRVFTRYLIKAYENTVREFEQQAGKECDSEA